MSFLFPSTKTSSYITSNLLRILTLNLKFDSLFARLFFTLRFLERNQPLLTLDFFTICSQPANVCSQLIDNFRERKFLNSKSFHLNAHLKNTINFFAKEPMVLTHKLSINNLDQNVKSKF